MQSGEHIALFKQALDLLRAGDRKSSVAILQTLAEDGFALGQYRFAKLHEAGTGVARNLAIARTWTERAAEGGNIRAMHDLAVYYSEGESGAQSYAKAVEWFERASLHGVPDSQYNLAILYEAGLGVDLDPETAAYWFEVGARRGDSESARRAQLLYDVLGPETRALIRSEANRFRVRPFRAIPNGIFPI